MKNIKAAIVVTVFLIIASAAAAEDIRIPHRYFEIGVSPNIGFSNNVFGIADIFQKNLVFDLRKIADNTPKSGFVLNANIADPLFFMNLNLRNGFHIGVNAGVDGNVTTGFGKSLMDAFGYGIDSKLDVAAALHADFFAYAGITSAFKVNDMRFSIAPSLVMPILHAETNSFSANFVSTSTGDFNADFGGALGIYSSIFDVSELFEGNFSGVNMNELMGGAGFDVGLGFEMPLPVYDKLQLGGYARVPVVPGTLKHGYTMDIDVPFHGNLQDIFAGKSNASDPIKLDNYSGDTNYKISRPMRMGVEAAYRPFGSWLTLYGMFGLGMRYPYTSNITFYPEYSLGVSANAKETVGISFKSSYLNQIFSQELNFMLNAKIFELNTAISMQSEDFLKSFQAAGFGVKVYLAFGVPVMRYRRVVSDSYIMVPPEYIPPKKDDEDTYDDDAIEIIDYEIMIDNSPIRIVPSEKNDSSIRTKDVSEKLNLDIIQIVSD